MDPLPVVDEFKTLLRTIIFFIYTADKNRESNDYWSIEELEDCLLDS